jgi:hypothetical protein
MSKGDGGVTSRCQVFREIVAAATSAVGRLPPGHTVTFYGSLKLHDLEMGQMLQISADP